MERSQPFYKAGPEDFVVEELALYEPSGAGAHVWLWVEKRGVTTHAAARTLALKLGKNPLDAGIAGLKDAQAVTRQWITFEHPTLAEADCERLSDAKVRVLTISRHKNKLRMGHLRGNRFHIALEGLADAVAGSGPPTPPLSPGEERGNGEQLAGRFAGALELVNKEGFPNYFGAQRFGSTGENAALGKLLVLGDENGFRAAMAAQNQGRQAHDRKLRNLLVNAFQSSLFNEVLRERLPQLHRLLPGDLACLHRNGAVFSIADDAAAALEQPRADAHEISPSGPLFGPKTPLADGLPGASEARVLALAGVTAADFGRREAGTQPGARRPLRSFFIEQPKVHPGRGVEFALSSGCYATVVMDHLLSLLAL